MGRQVSQRRRWRRHWRRLGDIVCVIMHGDFCCSTGESQLFGGGAEPHSHHRRNARLDTHSLKRSNLPQKDICRSTQRINSSCIHNRSLRLHSQTRRAISPAKQPNAQIFRKQSCQVPSKITGNVETPVQAKKEHWEHSSVGVESTCSFYPSPEERKVTRQTYLIQ